MKDKMDKGHVFKGLKFFIFLVLLIAIILQYLVGIYDKFFNSSTTLVSITTEAQDFTMPPLTICMDNGLKPSVLKKYGLGSSFDFMFGLSDSNISSVWEAFIEASYILDRQENYFILMYGPCHLDRALDDKFSVECLF